MAEEHKEEHGGGEAGHGGGGHGGGGHGGGGHGGGGHEEHEGAPEWLISFADNVALMMGFFVILLAMNMQKPAAGGVGGEAKFPADTPSPQMDDFAIEMRAAFNHPVDINSSDPHEQELVKRLKERSKEGGHTNQPGVDGQKHDVQAPRTSDWVKPTAVASFIDQDAQLSDEGKRSMAQAAEQLRGQHWIVEVRGHVSATEARAGKEQAMQLGFERAKAAARELIANGMIWEQIRVVSCADNERAVQRADSPEGHRNNQRVEIVQTQEPVPGDPYNQSGSGAGTPPTAAAGSGE